MRYGVVVAALMLAALLAPAEAGTRLEARIDISEQRMQVLVDGEERHVWDVSTGRGGYRTPTGTFKPTRMYRRYFSVRYHGAPMPHSVFFHKGYAIHGTTETGSRGRPASHGCVRLHPDNAKAFFAMVEEVGRSATRIVVTQ